MQTVTFLHNNNDGHDNTNLETHLDKANKQSSIVSLWALVKLRALERLYIAWMRESTSKTWSSKAQRRGEHLVSRGSTLVHKYRFSARAISVEPKSACNVKRGDSLLVYCIYEVGIFHWWKGAAWTEVTNHSYNVKMNLWQWCQLLTVSREAAAWRSGRNPTFTRWRRKLWFSIP